MRLSIRTLFRVLKLLLPHREKLDPARVFANPYWRDFWIALNSKRGANAACFECMYVCPIGQEDARRIMGMPYRKHDIPGGKVRHERTDQEHAVVYTGPPGDRVHEYSRHLEFGGVLPSEGDA